MADVYRATRNEPRVGVGEWTGDFRQGYTYVAGDASDEVPAYICDYLVSHGLLEDIRVASGPSASPAPPVGPTPPKVTKLGGNDG